VTAGPTVPARLPAPPPGWTVTTDVVVVGTGIAGLTVALNLHEAGHRVLVVTKDVLNSGSTRWAQGGIAAALAPGDSPGEHLDDTLVAGAGVCDEAAVRLLVTEGPAAVAELVERGTRFDRTGAGELSLTREGGHHRDRIAHAGGDATGAEISRALVAALQAADGIEIVEHALALDLELDAAGTVNGLRLHVMGEGQRDGVGAVRCSSVVLASGGLGQIFASSTNPPESTADGMAMALRAGAVLRDLEFVQFHPTVLWLGSGSRGQQPLVSEAVRGEGAVLVDADGERVMLGVHPMADLAPRDVVSAAIVARMRATGTDHVFLDARGFGEQRWESRFPTILAACRMNGIDPVTQLIPVAPACHYASGGVATDIDGRSSIPGLYACGEVACTGVHGANRLASNSLLEGLVFGRRISRLLAAGDPLRVVASLSPAPDTDRADDTTDGGWLLDPEAVPAMRSAMSDGSGVLRRAQGMADTTRRLHALQAESVASIVVPEVASWEASNLFAVSTALVQGAAIRAESRGSHRRSDFPAQDDIDWVGHLDHVLGADGSIATTFHPAPLAMPDTVAVEVSA
jgi:L-aspartate oxidase